MRFMKSALAGAVFAAGMTLGMTGGLATAGAQTTELKLAHFLPTINGMHSDFLEPWARELEKRTNGKVKVTIYPAGTQLGNIAKLYDSVRSGVVDIAHGLRGIPRGRFPRTEIIELPFMTGSADAASRALWAVYPKYLKEEYPGVKVLALHAHNGGLIHTRDKQVVTMGDLKGLRIRFPSAPIKSMLESLGAVPQGLPPGKVYENTQKGVIDGTVFPWDPMNSFKLSEVMNHHLDMGGIYTVSFWFAMNEKKYNSLPADVRQVIDDMSGDNLVGKFGPWWDKWDSWGIEKVKAKGSTITKLGPEEAARWKQATTPIVEEWLANMEANGISNAREIYDAMKAEIAKAEGN